MKLFNSLPRTHWPKIIREDCGFGNDAIMDELEGIEMPYLFKLKQSKGVKALINQYMFSTEWEYAGQGWEGIEFEIELYDWQHKRRIIILRKMVPQEVAVVAKKKQGEQLELNFAETHKEMKVYEYAVLVTNLEDEILTLTQHHRDRADSENNFDELKNQWGCVVLRHKI